MLKKYLLVLAAAGAISMVAPFAAAQDTRPMINQHAGSQRSHRHGPPDPASAPRNSQTTSISLRPARKVLSALQSEHSQMESLHQDTSLPSRIATLRWWTSAKRPSLRSANCSTRISRRSGTRCKPSVSNGCRIVAEDRQMRVRASSHRSHS